MVQHFRSTRTSSSTDWYALPPSLPVTLMRLGHAGRIKSLLLTMSTMWNRMYHYAILVHMILHQIRCLVVNLSNLPFVHCDLLFSLISMLASFSMEPLSASRSLHAMSTLS